MKMDLYLPVNRKRIVDRHLFIGRAFDRAARLLPLWAGRLRFDEISTLT